jgi:lysophospholipase L1-like esterase
MGKALVRRRHSAFAAGLATLAMALGFTAIPADAASRPVLDYVALGDSYAAGQGATPYTDRSCFISRKGYPAIADNLGNVRLDVNAACSGQVVRDVLLDVPETVGGNTDIVTVTVGGNDLGTTNVLLACIPAPESAACLEAVGTARAKLTDGTLATELAAVVAAIHYESPSAKIVLTGYPLLFDPTHPFAGIANPTAEVLNALIANVAVGTGAQYVDVTAAFTDHGVGSAEPWINFNQADLLDPANFHPTGEGYRHGYFASLVGQKAFDRN